MRSLVYSIAAGVMLIPAYQGFHRGDAWFGWSFVASALFLFMAPALLSTAYEIEAEREPSPLDPWLPPSPYAPTAIAPADPLSTAGAIGAAPATLER